MRVLTLFGDDHHPFIYLLAGLPDMSPTHTWKRMRETLGVQPGRGIHASADDAAGLHPLAPTRVRKVKIIHFSPWAGHLQNGTEFVESLPQMDLRTRVNDPSDKALCVKARLDCDWHGEHVRAFNAMRSETIEFFPVEVVGVAGVLDVLGQPRSPHEEWWFVITGQHPQKLGSAAGRLLAAYSRFGIRTLYYAFDEASRTMPCFKDIAPHLSVLIHDESPLDPSACELLRPDATLIHRSWVANCVPYEAPFNEAPDERILFLGSQLGLTEHRLRQIEFLKERFKDRFIAIHDHSLPVAERSRLNRYKVSLCPEGRKFTTPGMSATHTDRPFWSGCLGMVPVSEDSRYGGRLEELERAGLIRRYSHGDLKSLAEACERALAATPVERRRIYDHFNRCESIGAVVADAIGAGEDRQRAVA
jgi:hypothetical protein